MFIYIKNKDKNYKTHKLYNIIYIITTLTI